MLEQELKKFILSKFKSVKSFSEKANIPYTTVDSILKRGVGKANVINIIKMCQALNIDTDALSDGKIKPRIENVKSVVSNQENDILKKYRTLDEHGKKMVDFTLNEEYTRCTYTERTSSINLPFSLLKASAGTGDWLDEEQLDTISVFDTPEARKADIVIEVDGNSMLPDFSDGDKVFVRLQPSVCENDIGIFFVDGCGYIKKMGNNELISTNPEFDNIPIYDYTNFRCVGKVIGKV